MLLQQDCLEFARDQPELVYGLIIADPPYDECVDAEWDNQWNTDEEYLNWLKNRLSEFARVLSKNGNLILYCKRQLLHHVKAFLDTLLVEQRTIIWVRRRNVNSTRGKTFASGYEPILWYSKSSDCTFNTGKARTSPAPHLRHRREYKDGGVLEKGVGLTDAWTDIDALPHNSPEKKGHPTQKPLQLSTRIVEIFSSEEERVFIPFAGSGSEIIACEETGRKWDATEINQLYFNMIRERLENRSTKL